MGTYKDIDSIMKLLISTLASEVSERLISTVEEHLIDKLASTPKGQNKLLLDSNDLCKQLSLSKSTIISLRKKGLPIIKIGNSVRFDPKAVMQFINRLNNKHDGKIN